MTQYCFKYTSLMIEQANSLPPDIRDKALSYMLRYHCGSISETEVTESKKLDGVGCAVAMLEVANIGANDPRPLSADAERRRRQERRRERRADRGAARKALVTITSRDELFAVPPIEAAARVLGIAENDRGAFTRCKQRLAELGEESFRRHLETVWTKIREGEKVKNPVGLFFNLCERAIDPVFARTPESYAP